MTEVRVDLTETGDISERTLAEIEAALAKALPADLVLAPDVTMPEQHTKPDVIMPPICDETGKVVRPAINLTAQTLANGQPIESFYDRGPYVEEVSYAPKPTEGELMSGWALRKAQELGLAE